MSCVRVGVVVGGVHDVVQYCGDVWDGNGRSAKLYGCVGGNGVGTVPRSVVIMMLDGWEGRGMNQSSSNSV